jgi:hypothetical protein
MVYDIIQGRYGKPYQNNLAACLSQSLSTSMVEQSRLFNLLEEYVNQDQPQASDSILPPSRLPMDLRAEEDAIRGNKRVLSEIDVSEWEITCTETCPREGKRSCNPSSATQSLADATPSRTSKRARKKERKRLRLIQEAQQPISKPKDLPPRLCYNCRQPRHFVNKCPKPRQQKPQQQKQNPGSAINNNRPSPQVEQSPLNFEGNTSIPESLFTSPCNFESRDEILLKGGRLWRPRFLITVINANDQISRVKPQSNLGQPGSSPENLVNEPQWTPWPSLHPPVVNPWSKTRSKPAWPLTSANVVRNFCRVPQNSPKHFKIHL